MSAPGPVTLVLLPDFKTNKKQSLSKYDPHSRLKEAVGLAQAIRLNVRQAEIISLRCIQPSTLFGKGIMARLKGFIEGEEITLVVIDASLGPVQQRNLEKALGCKVIDRTGLILEIFGERARTFEGRLQVELAALTYQRSRLVRSWTHLERQRGGLGFIGGPGETQLEVDRRLIDSRITRLRQDLASVKRTREMQRKARKKVPYPVVALVGYTNAGKSTLFNKLTNANVIAKDILFATLDPTMRALKLASGRTIILSDTVGFISDLPTQLVAAFRATLEEVLEADLLIHVRDISHADSQNQRRDVLQVLKELGLEEDVKSRMIEALNKIDTLTIDQKTLLPQNENVLPISALQGEGLIKLLEMIDKRLGKHESIAKFKLDIFDGAAVAWLYAHGEVLEHHNTKLKTNLKVRLSPADIQRFEKQFLSIS
ncbi:MAG: GTPase HflX [Alphaproteobacteria bacterium]|nr:GTPase HflX [Alphaproteobacteria bacterium]